MKTLVLIIISSCLFLSCRTQKSTNEETGFAYLLDGYTTKTHNADSSLLLAYNDIDGFLKLAVFDVSSNKMILDEGFAKAKVAWADQTTLKITQYKGVAKPEQKDRTVSYLDVLSGKISTTQNND